MLFNVMIVIMKKCYSEEKTSIQLQYSQNSSHSIAQCTYYFNYIQSILLFSQSYTLFKCPPAPPSDPDSNANLYIQHSF